MVTLRTPFLALSIVIGSIALAACGGGSGGGAEPTPPPMTDDTPIEPPADPGDDMNTGRIGPVPIRGLTYSGPMASGTTNAAGEFAYQNGDVVAFRLGATPIGSVRVVGDGVITLFDLQSAFPFHDVREIQIAFDDPDSPFTATANLIRALYSIDDDQNLANGVGIDPALMNVLGETTLDLKATPRRFAYSSAVQTIMNAADRSLMPLEVGVAHQYEAANIPLVEDGITVGRLAFVGDIVRLSDDVLGTGANTRYLYDPLGNRVRQESFDDQGVLQFVSVSEYGPQSLQTGRTVDSNGDGVIDSQTTLERDRAGNVTEAVFSSGTFGANESASRTTYDDMGLATLRTEDRNNDGSVESSTVTTYTESGEVARIEVDSDGDNTPDLVVTNTYDRNRRLIEQTFEGVGLDLHDVQDSQPPPIGSDATDRFVPQLPYWTTDTTFFSLTPVTPKFRRTRYLRDLLGRVVERQTDTDGDGIPDQVAQLDFEGVPVAWRYDAQGDGTFESTATYTYSGAGFLTGVEEVLVGPEETIFITRTITVDDNGKRLSIRTDSSRPVAEADEINYSYDAAGRVNLVEFSSDQPGRFINPREIQWENSVRLNDSRLYTLPPTVNGAFEFEYRDNGEPAVTDANGEIIGSYAGSDSTLSYFDITVHFVGLTEPYVMRIIGANLSSVAPEQQGFDAAYESFEACRENDNPFIEALEDGSSPRLVVAMPDNLRASDKPRATFIADPMHR